MYAKLFGRITESSLMEEAIPVRYTFVMMLAIADRGGLVVGTDVAIARRFNMPLEEFKACIEALTAPDPDSNSKELEGRRLVASEGERGYQIVNYLKYRGFKDQESKKNYIREYMRRYRACKGDVKSVNICKLSPSASVSESEREGYGKGKHPTFDEVKLAGAKIGMTSAQVEAFFNYYMANGWRVGRNMMRSMPHALAGWKARNYENHAGNSAKPNPRNVGVAIGPTDYGEAARRKLERQALEAGNQVASKAQGT